MKRCIVIYNPGFIDRLKLFWVYSYSLMVSLQPLGLSYGTAIDMWSFGCILAELYTGYPMFPAQDETELICCIMEILDVPPLEVLIKSSRRKLFFHSNYTPRTLVNSKGKERRPGSKSFESVYSLVSQLEVVFDG